MDHARVRLRVHVCVCAECLLKGELGSLRSQNSEMQEMRQLCFKEGRGASCGEIDGDVAFVLRLRRLR